MGANSYVIFFDDLISFAFILEVPANPGVQRGPDNIDYGIFREADRARTQGLVKVGAVPGGPGRELRGTLGT